MRLKKHYLACIFLYCFITVVYAQDDESGFKDDSITYQELMEQNNYKEASEVLTKEIQQINSTRVERKEIPSDFISFAAVEDDIDVNQLFNQRKLELYVIEEHPELNKLHYDIALCFREMKDYERSVKHFQQALRYKKIEFGKDDKLFYDLSQTYKAMGEAAAYHNTLEAAYYLNRKNFDYSKELGISLYKTKKRKKAIYHLHNYVSNTSQEDVDPDIFIKLANLYADDSKFIKTEEYYSAYLKINTEDGAIYYALGVVAFQKTGNFNLALSCFSSADQYLKDEDIVKKSRLREYTADIYKKRLKYKVASEWYVKSIELESLINKQIEKKRNEIETLQQSMNELKASLLKQNDYIKYNEYQFQSQELNRLKYENTELEYQFKKMNSGKKRWKLAFCYEKLDNLEGAIEAYKESIKFNYNANQAREKIKKIQLKIKRGY